MIKRVIARLLGFASVLGVGMIPIGTHLAY
jgi:hypothetical protein